MANGGIIGPVKVVCTPSTKVTSFTSSGTFRKKSCNSVISEVMVVAGGGAGGISTGAGGGGAGGYRTGTCVTMPNENVTVTIGGGGAGGSPSAAGTVGENSNLGSVMSSGWR